MRVEAVVLAAGFSSRAGTYKMALEIDGKSVIEKCIEGMYDFCSRIYVVGGYRIEIIKEILKGYEKIEVVFNKDYEEGMFTSVKEGFGHIEGDAFFFTPGDYPRIGRGVYKKMLETEGNIIIPTYREKKGHPVLLKGCMAQELLNGNRFGNLKEFINEKGFVTVEVEDEGVLLDIDTIEDYEKLKRFESSENA